MRKETVGQASKYGHRIGRARPVPPPAPSHSAYRSQDTLPHEMAADPAVHNDKLHKDSFVINAGDDKEEVKFITDLFKANNQGWARHSYDCGSTSQPVSFKVKDGAKPYFAKSRPLPPAIREDALLLLDTLLQVGLVEESKEAPKILSSMRIWISLKTILGTII